MKVAFLFPGQGARDVVRGVSLAKLSASGAALLQLASDLARADLEANEGRALERTEVLQPALTAVSLAVAARLAAANVAPALVLGHSLGELAAFSVAGAFSAADAVRLAATRGGVMARAAAAHPGGLLALGSKADADSAIALSAGRAGLAAHNAPDEWVLWAEEAALLSLSARFKARRVPVSGPWHSPFMADAAEELRRALTATARAAPATPVVRCADGALAPPSADAALQLADALTAPAHFVAALETLRAEGVTHLVTIGPGAVLRALVRRTLGTSVTVLTTEDEQDLTRTARTLAGGT